jgi:hypothetical protein
MAFQVKAKASSQGSTSFQFKNYLQVLKSAASPHAEKLVQISQEDVKERIVVRTACVTTEARRIREIAHIGATRSEVIKTVFADKVGSAFVPFEATRCWLLSLLGQSSASLVLAGAIYAKLSLKLCL